MSIMKMTIFFTKKNIFRWGIAVSFFVFLFCFLKINSIIFAYPIYNPNSDLVLVGPYDTATSGAANWGNSTQEFITIGQKYRIRQTGTISRIRIYTASTTHLTGFYFKVWRKDGTTYDLVGTSENIVSNLTSGNYTTVDLSSPISGVQEGDYYGYRIESTLSSFYAKTSVTGVTSYYITGTVSSTDYDWESTPPNSKLAGAVLPIELYMNAPQFAFIGDSIIAGHPSHYSFLESTVTTNIASTIEKQFGDLTSYTYQNMGIGSQKTASISARFTNDIINLHPRVAVLEGGVNDIAGGVTKSTFIANWASMLDRAQASDSITNILVIKILPWSNGTTAQMQTRDDWNTSLATLAAGYSKAIVVDASSYVGEFRAGGDADNLWDIQAAYNADGVHFNLSGHAQIAQAIADSLITPHISSLSPSDNATQVSVVSNLSISFDRVINPQAGADNDIV
ncbi:MAG: GDSL-type esterase/lipase family protein, partial [Minisyncoccia bacterium]